MRNSLLPALILTAAALGGDGAPPSPATPFLVRDLHSVSSNADGVDGDDRAFFAGRLFYRGFDPRYGVEPWSSDGTPEGTGMLRDVCPGACSSGPADFTVAGGRLFFSADDGVFGREPWKSDGTAGGTELLRDVIRGRQGSREVSGRFAAVGERLFFVADRPERTELWSSDGTRRGTKPVVGCTDCGEPGLLTGAETLLYFFLVREDREELWVSDGTPAGTRRVVADCGSCFPLGAFHDRLLFQRRDAAHGNELWVSDGTPAGTELLLDACRLTCSGYPADVTVYRDAVYFTARSSDSGLTSSRGLFRSDGTRGGTGLFVGMRDGLNGVYDATLLGDEIYFLSFDAGSLHRSVLWKVDLSTGEPDMVSFQVTDFFDLTAVGNRLYMVSSRLGPHQVWTSDGTATGIVPVSPRLPRMNVFHARAGSATPAPDRFFFLASEDGTGWELWSSDGTEAGTRRTVDAGVDPGSSAPRQLARVGDRLLFVADQDDGTARLWRSDGTPGGTTPLGVGPEPPQEFGRLGDDLIFSSPPFRSPAGLWRSDGTPFGTTLLDGDLHGAVGFTPAGGRVFFAANSFSGEIGFELRTTDGTPEGTRLVRDIVPGLEPSVIIPCCGNSSSPHELTALGPGIVFAAADELFGENVELWRSDGSEDGTTKVAEICPGPCSSSPSDLVAAGGRVYFAADDGEHGRELWVTDGTGAGTRQVADLSRVAAGSSPHDLFVLGDRVYFFARKGRGEGLWTTDGTAAGTVRVHSLVYRGSTSRVISKRVAGERVFFVAASEATGPELWVSDGTAAGTGLVRDLRPGRLGSYPEYLTPLAGGVVFAADDGEAGREPWWSDGTKQGTRRLADVAAGRDGSNPADFVAVGPLLYFSADTSESGRELWAIGTNDGSHLQTRLLGLPPVQLPVPEQQRVEAVHGWPPPAATQAMH